ncbi:galaxin [Plakobranchus ocellatus]|uniref:Galaxin n=1 Tax=Plakobranchus ocellatus TaxID=259542 RepID=A0AAV4DIA4_9GAST|nr:galaxin [Plakobranchus ocellatus]
MFKKNRTVFEIVAVIYLSISVLSISAQNQRSPFRPPGEEPRLEPAPRWTGRSDEQVGPARQGDNGGGPVRSPFTPPPSMTSAPSRSDSRRNPSIVRPNPPEDAQRRQTIEKVSESGERRNTDSAVAFQRAREAKATEAPAWPVESPFSPPAESEWQDSQKFEPPATWREERERQPVPPTVRTDNRLGGSRRRPGIQRLPKASVYQERDNPKWDMHEEAPGVTPWTRYTPRPRVRGQEVSQETRDSRARCGRLAYSPRRQICCQGEVKRRQGMKPSCCGRQPFDSAFSKCCDGVISLRTVQSSNCP